MPVSKKEKYLDKAEWRRVGEIGIDTGQCWLGDPLFLGDANGIDGGVSVYAGLGDGTYPVYVRLSAEDGRTSAVLVDFLGEAFGEVKE
jgi:hypothetical protein